MQHLNYDQKFDIAVNIIKRLPKEGSFSPSNDLKLKFYSLFKQATEGPCTIPKPGFWDVINRVKWEAWNKLGDLSVEESKKMYVENFIQIMRDVEITERSENEDDLREVVKVLGPFVEIVLPKYPFLKKVMTNGSVPSAESSSPADHSRSNGEVEKLKNRETNNNTIHPAAGEEEEDLDEEENFSDSSDQIVFMECSAATEPAPQPMQTVAKTVPSSSSPNWVPAPAPSPQCGTKSGEVDEHLAVAVLRLQNTLVEVQNRLDYIETLLQKKKNSTRKPWLSVLELSTPALCLILGWPFLIHLLLHTVLVHRHRSKQ